MPLNLHDVARFVLPKPPPGGFFSDGERRTMIAAAEVLLAGSAVDIPMADVVTNAERFLLRGRSRRTWRVRILVQMLELSPLFVGKKPFSQLSLADRRWMYENKYIGGRGLWGVVGKIKDVVHIAAYSDPRVWPAVGYIPVAQRARYKDPVASKAAGG